LQWYIKIFFRRIFWKLFHKYFIHWVNHIELGEILEKIGIFDYTLVENPDYNHIKYNKKQHDVFNILYYYPNKRNEKFIRWTYGIETISLIIDKFKLDKKVNWIRLDGSINMKNVLPIADCYIKANTRLGSAKNRIAKECDINNIPVIYTDYKKTNIENIEYVEGRINELRENADIT